MASELTITLTAQQRVAVRRFRDALQAAEGVVLSDEEAAQVLLSTACAAWMDADEVRGTEVDGA